MNIFKKLNADRYQLKADRKIKFESIFKLQDECTKLGLVDDVVGVCDGEQVAVGEYIIPSDKFSCYQEKNKKFSAMEFENTYYFFKGNTCIIYHRAGQDRIIRILVKNPSENWRGVVSRSDCDDTIGLTITNNKIEVYNWWDVDWMGTGKNDMGSYGKSGAWWKTIYNDVCGIYEYVAMQSVDWKFNAMYAEREES